MIPEGWCWLWSGSGLLTGGLLTLFSRIQKRIDWSEVNFEFYTPAQIWHVHSGAGGRGEGGLVFIQSHSRYDGTSEVAAAARGLMCDLKVYTNTRIPVI